MSSTKILWRVQTLAGTGNWINRGLFEVRWAAREDAARRRELGAKTRVLRYEKKGRK